MATHKSIRYAINCDRLQLTSYNNDIEYETMKYPLVEGSAYSEAQYQVPQAAGRPQLFNRQSSSIQGAATWKVQLQLIACSFRLMFQRSSSALYV